MSRTDGAGEKSARLACERERLLEALDCETLSVPAILRRLDERSTGAEVGAEYGAGPSDQSLLYPALHSLEANWRVQARWLSDTNGRRHRIYRKRRLLPRESSWTDQR